MTDFKKYVRTAQDFPQRGVDFIDITPILTSDAGLCKRAVNAMADAASGYAPHVIVGLEARGFIFGAAVAHELGLGFVPIRKAGKLPFVGASQPFTSEYEVAWFESPAGAFGTDEEAVIIDDVLATGGSIIGAKRLLASQNVRTVGAVVLFDVPALLGRHKVDEAGINITVVDGSE